MQSNIQKNDITGSSDLSSINQHSFTLYRAATYDQVMEKAKAFGFRETEVALGLKITPVKSKKNQSSKNLDSKCISLKTETQKITKRQTVNIASKYFPPKIVKHFTKPSDNNFNDALSLIDKAYAYDAFIQTEAKKMIIESETFPEFLKRVEGDGGKHSRLLKNIANGIKSNAVTRPESNGLQLMALWVEFSNATAMHNAEKADLFESQNAFKWEEFEEPLPYSGKRKINSLDNAGESSTNPKKTRLDHDPSLHSTAFTRSDSTDSDQLSNTDSNETTSYVDQDYHPLTPSCSRTPNFNEETGDRRTDLIDQTRTEGKSENEINSPVKKVKHLTKQALNQVEEQIKQQRASGKTVVSESDKGSMISQAINLLSAINQLTTRAIEKD